MNIDLDYFFCTGEEDRAQRMLSDSYRVAAGPAHCAGGGISNGAEPATGSSCGAAGNVALPWAFGCNAISVAKALQREPSRTDRFAVSRNLIRCFDWRSLPTQLFSCVLYWNLGTFRAPII
jgi:hypothetical protein